MVSWKPRYWLLVIAGLFICGFFYNVAVGDFDYRNALMQWGIAAICGSAFTFVSHEDRQRAAFLRFLHANRADILATGVTYRGQRLTATTRVRTCEIVMSFLVRTVQMQSRYLVLGAPTRGIPLACSLTTVVFGWWVLGAGGAFKTIHALANNARHKPVVTIGELLA